MDSALAVAAVTATLYLAGSLSADGYFSRLGVPRHLVPLRTEEVLERGFTAMLAPLIWLVMMVVVYKALLERLDVDGDLDDAHPWRSIQPLTIVATLWFLKQLTDLVGLEEPQSLGLWSVRDIALVVLGAFWFLSPWIGKRLVPRWGSPRENRINLALFVTGTAVLTLVILHVVSTGQVMSKAVGFGLLWVAFVTVVLLRRRHGQKADSPHQLQPARDVVNGAPAIMRALLAVLLLLGAAAFDGANAARDITDGCTRVKSVWFEPEPMGLPENKTFWLVWHTEGTYLVKTLPTNSTSEVFVVESPPGTVAGVAFAPQKESCKRGSE